MRRIAPGVYADDATDTLHIDIDELLDANGYEQNEQTRAALTAAWRQFVVDHGIPIEFRE
jgi:hypothetical protein